jgi:hypothetical protein
MADARQHLDVVDGIVSDIWLRTTISSSGSASSCASAGFELMR